MQWYKCDFLATERRKRCVPYKYAHIHKVAGRDLRLCLLTLFQVDGAWQTYTHMYTSRYTLFGSVPNSKYCGGNYWTHSHTCADTQGKSGKTIGSGRDGRDSHTLKMQKVNDCAGKATEAQLSIIMREIYSCDYNKNRIMPRSFRRQCVRVWVRQANASDSLSASNSDSDSDPDTDSTDSTDWTAQERSHQIPDTTWGHGINASWNSIAEIWCSRDLWLFST